MSFIRNGLVAMCALLPAACGSVSSPADAGMVEDQPPKIDAVVPADGAVGVAADAKIQITFSKAMDQAATQIAFQSPDLPSNTVVMTWNGSGTMLTIAPNAPLTYATGADPATVTAKAYSFLVTTAAVDTTGHHLASMFTASFHTRRRIQLQPLALVANLSGVCYGGTSVGNGARMITGDSLNQSVYKGLASFSTATLPVGVHGFEAAPLTFNYSGVEGAPFPSLGAISVEQITFPAMTDAFAATAHANLGTLAISSAADVGPKTVDATTSMGDIYANRATNGDLAQYRLAAAVATNNNNTSDFFAFDTTPFASLSVTYTAD